MKPQPIEDNDNHVSPLSLAELVQLGQAAGAEVRPGIGSGYWVSKGLYKRYFDSIADTMRSLQRLADGGAL